MTPGSVLTIGFFLGVGMIVWGVWGMVRGAVIVKSYGMVDGERRYYRTVRRDEEPVWFWVSCLVVTSVGLAVSITVLLYARCCVR